MSFRITDRDRGFAARMRAIRSKVPKVLVGIPSDAPAAEAASLAEFGTRNEPPRPIVRGWFDAKGEALGKRLERAAAEEVYRGGDPQAAAARMGEALAASQREHLRAGIAPALSPDTENPDRPPFAGTSIEESIGFQTVK